MNFGLRKMQMSRAAVPPIRMRPINRSPHPSQTARLPRSHLWAQSAAGLSRGPSADPCTQRFARDGDVVEWHLDATGELLALLMALACDHEDVAALRECHRSLDRGTTIDLGRHRRSAGRTGSPTRTVHDLGDDRL